MFANHMVKSRGDLVSTRQVGGISINGIILMMIIAVLAYTAWGTWRDDLYLTQGRYLSEALVQAKPLRQQIERNMVVTPGGDPCQGLAPVYEVGRGAKIHCHAGHIRIDAVGISGIPAVSIELQLDADQGGPIRWRCVNLSGRVWPSLPHVCMP